MRRALVAALFLLAHVACAAADPVVAKPAAAPARPAVTLLPGVIVDPAANVTYVMVKSGAIEAVASSGKTRWASKQAEKPLWLVGSQLLAQKGTSLVVLDARTGKVAKTCTPAAGTSWQPPPITASMTGSSSMVAADGGAGKAILSWSRETHYMGGPAPTPEMSAAAASYAEGNVEADLAGCTFKELSTYVAPKAKPGQPIARTPVHGAAPPKPPTVVDGFEITVEVTTDAPSDTSRAVLHRTRNGAALADVEIAKGKAGYVNPMVAADGRHVLAVIQDPASGGNGGPFYYDHTLVDAVTGAKVATFRMPWHAGAVIVLSDGTLVDADSYVMHGVDTKKGKERWKRDVRHTWYEGPLPP